MDFMAVWPCRPEHDFVAKMAEEIGYTHAGFAEGPLLTSELYANMALAARATRRIKLGPCVTNPITRTPPQTANGIATINFLAPGRVFCGLGTGNNALRSLGLRPARMAETEEAINIIKGLLSGQRVLYKFEGKERFLEFVDELGLFYNAKDPVPIFLACGGAKSIELAGRLADAVIYPTGGPCIPLLRLARRMVDESARKAGRDPKSIKFYAMVWFYMLRRGEGWEEAIKKGYGTAPLNTVISVWQIMQQHASEFYNRLISDTVKARKAFFVPGDPKTKHLDVWKTQARLSMWKTAAALLTKDIADAFSLYGTPEECLEKAKSIAKEGVDGIIVGCLSTFTTVRDVNDFAQAVIRNW